MAVAIKTDAEIQQEVLARLAREPEIDATGVGVEVADGIVTLSGTAATYAQRWAAESAALRVEGVRAVANDIVVRRLSTRIVVKRPWVAPGEIKAGIERALARRAEDDAGRIRVHVEGGHVTLAGTVRSPAERRAAAEAARGAKGVVGVTNQLRILSVRALGDGRPAPGRVSQGIPPSNP